MTLSASIKYYWVQFLITLILLAGLYRSILPDMVQQWYADANYSHGFLVPLISVYFMYLKRHELFSVRVEPWPPGFALFLFGLAQLVVGSLATEFFTMRSSLVVILSGLILFFFGKGLFRIVCLPIAYLIFMVPLPYIVYDSIAFPLKLLVTRAAIAFLKFAGVAVLAEGTIIMLPLTTLEVADACSGIRSLISLIALSAAYAILLKMTALRKTVLIISAVPIAIAANAFRVIGTGLLAQHFGARAAEGFFHEFAGLVIFAVAMALLIALGFCLAANGRRGP